MKLEVTIRAAEGGDDAKLLVGTQAEIYERYCAKHSIKCKTINSSASEIG